MNALERLIGALDAAAALPPGALGPCVESALADALAASDWLAPERRRASPTGYARHLLHADPAGRFSLLALVWAPGQASPIHDHHTWCAVGIYSGQLTEVHYEHNGSGAPRPLRSTLRRRSSLSFDHARNGAHRIANHGAGPAISLHVYGVGGNRIASGVNRILE